MTSIVSRLWQGHYLIASRVGTWQKYDKYSKQAMAGTLPHSFKGWDLADAHGWTIAHVAADYSHLPADFNQWHLANNYGDTVAHVIVERFSLPDSFDQWGMADNEGLTVLRHFLLNNYSERHEAMWEQSRPLYRAKEDWDVFKAELPGIYQKYTIGGCMQDVDNEQRISLL
jgi:hypothetical protein